MPIRWEYLDKLKESSPSDKIVFSQRRPKKNSKAFWVVMKNGKPISGLLNSSIECDSFCWDNKITDVVEYKRINPNDKERIESIRQRDSQHKE